MSDSAQLFLSSLQRASARANFLDIFYASFIQTSAEIREIFAHTDMDSLKQKLNMTLNICSQAAGKEPGCERYLEHLGRVHGNLNIREAHYQQWLESLIRAVDECDPEFSPLIEQAWREHIGNSIRILTSQTQNPHG